MTGPPAPPPIDEPAPVRPGEELDAAALDLILKERVPGLAGTPEVLQFPGGASNLTYLVRYPQRELVLRRPPPGYKAKSAHDMAREFSMLAALRPVYPCVPRVLAYVGEGTALGTEFYVMERIRGVIVRRELPDGLVLTPAQTRRLCLNVIDKLVELHQLDYRAAGLETMGKGEGYVRRQVQGWTDRYRRSRTPDVADFEEVMAWLRERTPGDRATCVIHNDFRFDNVVLDPGDPFRVIGVLDWEMATLGDPFMDLGSALAYWVQADDDRFFLEARLQPTHLPGMPTRSEVVSYYASRTGRAVEDFVFYAVFGLFRLAAIAQQIYFRSVRGPGAPGRFASFGALVTYLERRCRQRIARPEA
jgi:aminoglycoside phosphotransferase (APT) family kinase protein